MADYNSMHSGANIDLAITKILNGTSGLQGLKVFGTELSPDAENKVNIDYSNLFKIETFSPLFGDSSVTCTYEYNLGTSVQFGSLVYISARIKAKVVSVSTSPSYCVLRGYPYQPVIFEDGAPEYAVTISEFSSEDSSIPYTGNVTARIGDTGTIMFEQLGGMSAIPIVANPNKFVWVSVSCIYLTSGLRNY